MRQLMAEITENEKIAWNFYRIRLKNAYLARNIKPGQFVEVKCSERTEPLLRRPFSLHRISRGGIEIMYEIVGNGTAVLSGKKPGDVLDVIGPLGSGFDISGPAKTAILVAGGIGVAPLLALAEELAYRGKIKTWVFIGAKTKNHLLCERDFKKAGREVIISTEDGSKGQKGFITTALINFLNAKRYTLNAKIYACGPAGMLKAVAKIAKANRMPCQVSLEERMACGVGVCLGCPVRVREFASSRVRASRHTNTRTHEHTNYAYKMVCKDGPVFNAEEIIW